MNTSPKQGSTFQSVKQQAQYLSPVAMTGCRFASSSERAVGCANVEGKWLKSGYFEGVMGVTLLSKCLNDRGVYFYAMVLLSNDTGNANSII